jgi:hypothetical protein
MKLTIAPKSLGHTMGFGKYKALLVKEIYTGTEEVPDSLYKLWLSVMINHETKPKSFVCANLEELNSLVSSYGVERLDNVIKNVIEMKFTEFADKESDSVDEHLIPYYRKKSGGNCAEVNRIMALCKLVSDEKFIEYYHEYFSSLESPLTDKDCQIIQTDFIKNYIIFSSIGKSKTLLDKKKT